MERMVRPDPALLPENRRRLAEVELHRLLGELVRRAGGRDASRLVNGDTLLDVEVNGVRCVLVATAGGPRTAGPAARPPVPSQPAQPYRPAQPSQPAAQRPATVLSPREYEIARMVGLGHTNKTIAQGLGISLWTVATHLRRIFAKLGVSTRAAMIGALAAELAGEAGPGSAAS